MSARTLRSRFAIGCLVTILLPAGVVLAESETQTASGSAVAATGSSDREPPNLAGGLVRPGGSGSAFTFWDPLSVSPTQTGAASGSAPAAFTSASTDAPWFRITIPFRAGGNPPAEPADGAASKEQPAKAKPAEPKVKPPGVVPKFRRADSR